jgi:uncharacterized protein involved in outer membrane biogenesis
MDTGIFLALLVLIVLLVDWNGLREPIARRISSATGRSVAVNGDLSVHLSWPPRIVANNVVFGNAAWSPDPAMAEDQAPGVDDRPVQASEPAGWNFPKSRCPSRTCTLEVRPDGVPNWVFNEQDKNHPVDFPTIGVLTIDHGSVTYRDPQVDTEHGA